jgi:glycosyltransferase involved in cell wall biosynthesis
MDIFNISRLTYKFERCAAIYIIKSDERAPMKILHTVEYYSPSVGGAQEVVKQVSEQLVKFGHSVTVATTKLDERTSNRINGVSIEEFSISGNAIRGFHGESEKYQKFLINGDFDVIMNYAAQQWSADLVFPLIDRLPFHKILTPCGFSGLFVKEYDEYFKRMPDILRQYDHLIFHSGNYRDIEFAKKHGISKYTVIPNGTLADEFNIVDHTFRQRYGIPENALMLLTVGNHTGFKGHKLAIDAFRRANIGDAYLVIIGNTNDNAGCLPDCRRRAWITKILSGGKKKVLLLNPPRPDVISAYHAADLFVFGSNVECSPLVLFEAMASKTPFITTACGNAEEIVKWGNGGVIIPTIKLADGRVDAKVDSMAKAIEDLVNDQDRLSMLGISGYSAWKDKFTWEKIAHRYEELYRSLI